MKKIKYYLFIFITFLVSIEVINAFSVSSNSSVYVGETITIIVNCSGSVGNVTATSSNNSVLSAPASQWCDNTSIYFYAKANSKGVATLTFSAVLSDYGVYEDYNTSRSTNAINVINRTSSGGNTGGTSKNGTVDINKKYKSNNNLKELEVDGYSLNPKFNKDVLEYEVELDPGTESINIKAVLEDSSATVKGAGDISVSDGINIINIVVVAENGNEKKYIIKASVEEKDPIEVKINKQKYRVVKKKELIGNKDGFSESNVKINNFDIPALYNDVTKVTLVGLKDKNGNIILFAYDTTDGTYSEYKELSFSTLNLYIQENKNSKYKKTTIKINDVDVIGYKIDGIDDYYLVYATNTSTGYKGYYLYDTKENSVQRYDTTLLENLTKEKDKYLSIVIILSSVCFLSMLFLLIQVNRNSKKNEE